jgi:cytochrome bd-type quinol oxidase subunit 2
MRTTLEENHMSVIGPSCALPSENSPGCGCAMKDKTENKIAGAVTMTALAATACTACCILPFTLPAAVLALTGGSIAVLGHAHGWVTKLAVAAVVCTWSWIAWQRWQTGRRIARLAAALMILATLLTATTAAWPLIEPAAFHAVGIVKKKAARASE